MTRKDTIGMIVVFLIFSLVSMYNRGYFRSENNQYVSPPCSVSKDVRGEGWIFYSNLGGMSYYHKDSIIKISDNTVTVWTQVFPSQELIDLYRNMRIEYEKMLKEEGKKNLSKRRVVKDDVVYNLKSIIEINCETGSYRYLKKIMFNKSDEVIWSSDDNIKSRDNLLETTYQFQPNTQGFYFYMKVCNEGLKR